MHTPGTFAGWREIASEEKWLRIHNTHEWRDFYGPAYTEDLRRFFDHYLKGIDNGWERTPRIRAAVLDSDRQDELGRVIDAFLPDWPHRVLYLADDGVLGEVPQAKAASLQYGVEQVPGAAFRFKVPQESELIGYCKLKLWVEAEDADDMDLWVTVEKLDPQGGNTL